jgi:hypothetical protein
VEELLCGWCPSYLQIDMGYDMFLKKKIQVLVPIPVLQIRPGYGRG